MKNFFIKVYDPEDKDQKFLKHLKFREIVANDKELEWFENLPDRFFDPIGIKNRHLVPEKRIAYWIKDFAKNNIDLCLDLNNLGIIPISLEDIIDEESRIKIFELARNLDANVCDECGRILDSKYLLEIENENDPYSKYW